MCSAHQTHGAVVALERNFYVRVVVFFVVVEELITHIVDCDLEVRSVLSSRTAFGSKWSYMASSSVPLYSRTIPYSSLCLSFCNAASPLTIAPTLLVPNLKTHAPPTPYLPKKGLGAGSDSLSVFFVLAMLAGTDHGNHVFVLFRRTLRCQRTQCGGFVGRWDRYRLTHALAGLQGVLDEFAKALLVRHVCYGGVYTLRGPDVSSRNRFNQVLGPFPWNPLRRRA